MDNFPWIPCWKNESQDLWNLRFQVSIMELQGRKTHMTELQAPQESNFQDTKFEVSCHSFLNSLTLSLCQISVWNLVYNHLLLIQIGLKEGCKKRVSQKKLCLIKCLWDTLYQNMDSIYIQTFINCTILWRRQRNYKMWKTE